ncbi:MAG: M48 family metalloprotease [Gammaproteobacteria bacterium]|nr:M48 family metalloprotease [Gammaproteobacteria bacterium]
MNHPLLLKHRLLNTFQAIALILLLSILLGYLAMLLAGPSATWIAFLIVLLLYLTNPTIVPHFILRMYQAREISQFEAPEIFKLLLLLSDKAKLPKPPRLYYIPSQVINAFALGSPDDSALAISDGVLKKLNYKELAGILAHEITHIANNDIRVMSFADIASRITKLLSLAGQLLLLVTLPLIFFMGIQLNWIPIIILILAPVLSDLIQRGLSRIREYQADMGSALLLGDARPLASALHKMEHYRHNYLGGIFIPIQKIPEPSLLRTHPPTEERIKRLLEYQHVQSSGHELENILGTPYEGIPIQIEHTKTRRPRRYFTGFWY